jgi:short subunit fatty acids transporter
MIQRPQSIFLLIVIISLVIAMVAPIWHEQEGVHHTSQKTYRVDAWSLQEISYGRSAHTSQFLYAAIGWLSLIAVGIAVYELFKYNDRGIQMKLGTLNTLAMMVLLGCMLRFTTQQEANFPLEIPGKYQPGFLSIFVALASNLLASHYIRRDDKLVKEADRIR